MTHPDQSSPQAVWFTFAGGGADSNTGTNSPQHQASVGHAIFYRAAVRMKLPRHPEPKPNKLEDTSRGSKPILIAITPDLSSRVTPHGGLSSVAAPAGSCSPLSLLPGLFLNLQSPQDKGDRLRNMNPIVGKKIPILIADLINHLSQPFPSLVAVKSNHAGKDLGNVQEERGEIPNDRVEFCFSDDERAHSATRGSRKQDRAHSARSPKITMEIFARVFSLVR